jgi:DNA ligase 1
MERKSCRVMKESIAAVKSAKLATLYFRISACFCCIRRGGFTGFFTACTVYATLWCFSAALAYHERMHKLLRLAAVVLACLSWHGAIIGQTPVPSLLLAQVMDAQINPARYLVSEKLDGVRAVWDGNTLRFRSGNTVPAPAWFLAKLPATPLDGELWLARGKFDELSGIVRKTTPVDSEWQRITYKMFELPDAPGTFSQRYAAMQALAARTNWPQLQVVEQFRVAHRKELKRRLDDVVKAGGEGLMLHLADAPYVTGRSDVLLKLKPQLDTEAVVIAHIPGKGKYAGMLGALQLKTPQGRVFKLGTGFSDADRANPPPIGSTVTYTYRDLTKTGLPRFASFVRVRQDP